MSIFAEDPEGSRISRAPSLIETLIIVGILATLAASAMPFVRDAVVREKVDECLDRTAVVRTQIAEHYRLFGEWPRKINVRDHASAMVDAYCNGFSAYDRRSGAFKVNVNEESISTQLHQLQPELRPVIDEAGALTWRCNRGDTLPEEVKLLPEKCQSISS